ncbi:hypothetical protein J7T55_004313 [Diaporthe amygdali]|uniref:uncharacterized protein n=1 Tax=Phomopsis amygdali TaxID=1214568 RepID=UPI0022FE85AB|nr:uncharacterized protein J7T55_004313 [Diaporthe amygdali]KAJ0109764.1 hypothetical protein J7T55_004313 [Diaporthe amygdali]
MSLCDHLVESFARLTFTIMTYVMFVVVGEIIAAHQNGILRRSRQLQAFLHLPTCTHIFSEADTQIHPDNIKASAIALSFTILFVTAGMLDALIDGPIQTLDRPWVACGVIAVMATPGLVLWLHLALTCRRRQRNRRAVAWDIEDVGTDFPAITRGVDKNENTALLSSEREPKASEEDKVQAGDDQLRQDGPSKEEVGTADKSSQRDGHSNANVLRVPWKDSEFPSIFVL